MCYKLTKAIEEAIKAYRENGSCSNGLHLNDSSKTVVYAEWVESYDDKFNVNDVIEVYVYQEGICKFSIEIEETLTPIE